VSGPRTHRELGVILLLVAGLALVGCEDPPGTLIADATFDNDLVDGAPNATLPGEPAGDALTVTGGNQLRVRSSPPFSTKFLQVSRGNLEASVRLVPAATSAGRYKMLLAGVVSVNQAATRVRFVAGSAGELLLTFRSSGKVVVGTGDAPQEVGSYDIGVAHVIRVDLQASLGRAVVDVESPAGNTHTQYITLTPSSESGPAIVLFYPATLVEAFPGTYGIDQMTIRQI
jgi:hypothetical protein